MTKYPRRKRILKRWNANDNKLADVASTLCGMDAGSVCDVMQCGPGRDISSFRGLLSTSSQLGRNSPSSPLLQPQAGPFSLSITDDITHRRSNTSPTMDCFSQLSVKFPKGRHVAVAPQGGEARIDLGIRCARIHAYQEPGIRLPLYSLLLRTASSGERCCPGSRYSETSEHCSSHHGEQRNRSSRFLPLNTRADARIFTKSLGFTTSTPERCPATRTVPLGQQYPSEYHHIIQQ
jgi:hypothetical protein